MRPMPLTQTQAERDGASAPRGREAQAGLAFRVGGTSFGLFSRGEMLLKLDPCLRDFAVEARACDVRIGVGWAEELRAPSGAPRFQSGGPWSLYKDAKGYAFYFSTPRFGLAPYKAAWFDRNFRRGEVLLLRRYFDASLPLYPLEYPLDELLMVHRLSCGEGVEVHAAGVVDEGGRGLLFLGHSGAGKSTTARLWQSRPLAHILSDDRIILRASGERIWMCGTPWHGDAGIASPRSAPLAHVYFLEHGGRTELAPIPKGRAAAELLARSFVPHHSREGLQGTLQFLGRVAEEVPCDVLRFVPDISAIEAVCHAA